MSEGKVTIPVHVTTNLEEVLKKITRLEELMEEASSLIEELASEGIELELEV